MACSITLPFWPTAPGCISWSKDNFIAITGGASIAILTPRLKEPSPDGTNWDTTVFPINTFSESEIPMRGLLGNATYSIGEETSQWTAVRAIWSSPGIAPHKGCALAVLTSNHVLSIWAADGKPNVNSNWRRRLIVNHTLKSYYDEVVTPPFEDPRLRAERLQVSQRILAFAWSHPLHKTRPGEDSKLKNFLDWGRQFLAVATGCGDILIFRVQSSHLDRTSNWKIVLTDMFNVQDHVIGSKLEQRIGPMAASDDIECDAGGDPVADAVVWSDWSWDESLGEVATLAFVANGRLFTTKLRGSIDNELAEVRSHEPLVINSLLPDCSDVLPGPLEIVSDAEPQSIIVPGSGLIFQIPVNLEEQVHSHHLDDRWDEVTGVAACRHAHDKYTLHIISLLSSAKAPTAELRLPLQAGNKSSPSWQYSINATRASYSAEMDLEGNVLDRTYGIASSPFSNYVATCSSMHPSDALGYVIGSEQSCVLNISLEITPLYDEPICAPQSAGKLIPVPVETLVFEEKRRIENSVRFAGSHAPDQQTLTEQILRILPQYDVQGRPLMLMEGDQHRPESLIRLVRTYVSFDPELQACRAAFLAGFILDRPIRRDHVMRRTVQKLVDVILKLPTTQLHMDDSSLQIFRIYEGILSILESSKANADASIQGQENCRICTSQIPLVSVKWASCIKGHNFSRCALSFLSIPGPGTTKSCGICGALFLNEQAIPNFLTQSDTGTNLDTSEGNKTSIEKRPRRSDASTSAMAEKWSLVDILFTACDVCIYCGGRFVDQ